MKLNKLSLLGVATISTVVLGTVGAGTALAAPNFGSGQGTVNPMGPGTSDLNSIAVPMTGQGFYSGGTSYIAPTVGTSAAGANSTAQVAVAESGAPLRLDAVPNLNFGNTETANIIEGDTVLPYVDGTVSDSSNFDGNDSGMIQVTDVRGGDSAGWTLMAAVSPLTSMTNPSATLDGTLSITPKANTTNNTTTPAGTTTSISTDGNAQVVWGTTATSVGTGVNQAMVDSETTLTIAQNGEAEQGTYQSNVVWTLANTINASVSAANANADRQPTQ
ncbi:WxL domain-containing protein [Enterococcus sp. LJL90]